MSALTPEEQRFFETGELQPGMQGAPAPVPAPPPDPLDLQALATPPAVAPAPVAPPASAPAVAPAVAPAPPPSQADPTEFLTRRLADAQQQVAELQTLIRQAVSQPPASSPAPDPSTDPIGSLMHQLGELNKQVATLQQGMAQSQQVQQQTTQLQAFQQQVQQLKDQFVATTPDFNSAVEHLRTARISDLRAFGLTDAQISQQIIREEYSIAEAAIMAGKNPAQVIYEMSKRHGYTTAAPAPGAAPAAGPSIDAIARAQAAAKNLPAAAPAEQDLTIEALRQASDADLNKIALDPAAWNKLTQKDTYPL